MPEVVLRAQATDVRFEPAAERSAFAGSIPAGAWNASIVGTRVVNSRGGQGLKLQRGSVAVSLW